MLTTAHASVRENSGPSSITHPAAGAAWGDVLVADDDSICLQQIRELLTPAGWRVRVARDGAQWLAAIRENAFDLVIFEPNLPGRLWYSSIHDVRSHLGRARLIITTAFPSRALTREARALQAEAVLTKPFRIERLAATLRTPGSDPAAALPPERDPLPDGRTPSLARLEWEYINHILRRCDGNVSEASRHLRVPRQTLYRKFRKHPPPS